MMRDNEMTNGVYLWTDAGQFGAYLTEGEEAALTGVFHYFPVTDVRWTSFVHFRPAHCVGNADEIRRAMEVKNNFMSAMEKMGIRAVGCPFDWDEIREWVQPGNVWSVSRNHSDRGYRRFQHGAW
jgi:hypothetical protein